MQELTYLSAVLAIKRNKGPEKALELLNSSIDVHFKSLRVGRQAGWIPLPMYQLDESIQHFRGIMYMLCLSLYQNLSVFQANSEDPDEMPHDATSLMGLHCLPMSDLWDPRLKWVNCFSYFFKIIV